MSAPSPASSWELTHPRDGESRILARSALAALLIELAILTAVGWHEHWLAHPQKTTGLDTTKFVEAEVFQVPEEARLTEQKPVSVPAPREKTISTEPDRGKKSKSEENAPEKNVTQSGPQLAPTHGPVAVYAPPPAIPSYLQNQQLKASAVIDFYVTALGAVTPRLAGSTGNEELDAIAIEAVKRWQFRPAEKDHKPVDSKVRLRINFEVK